MVSRLVRWFPVNISFILRSTLALATEYLVIFPFSSRESLKFLRNSHASGKVRHECFGFLFFTNTFTSIFVLTKNVENNLEDNDC